MGIDLNNVTPSTKAAIELRCGLCGKLSSLDAVVTEECSHLFCKACAESLVSSAQQSAEDEEHVSIPCPTCNMSIPSSSGSTGKHKGALRGSNGRYYHLLPLKTQQPLAYRILTRIQICCPVQKHQTTCTWVGEYRQLSKHNKSTHSSSNKPRTSEGGDPVDSSSKHTTRSAPSSSNKKSSSNGKHHHHHHHHHHHRSGSKRDLRRHHSERLASGSTRSLSPSAIHSMRRNNNSTHKPNDNQEQQQNHRRSNSDSSLQVDQDEGQPSQVHDSKQNRPKNSSKSRAGNDEDPLQLLRDKAMKAFKAASYEESRARYTDAIAVCRQQAAKLSSSCTPAAFPPEILLGTLYANRAAACLKLKDRESCIKDTEEAIKLHPKYPKAYLRRAWAQAELGEFEEACTTLQSGEKKCLGAKELGAELKQIKKSRDLMLKSEKLLSQGKYGHAKEHMVALNHRSNSSRVVLALARADLGLGNTSDVITGADTVLQSNPRHVQALQLRGEAHFLNGNFKEAANDLTKACIIDPDSKTVTAALKRYRSMQRYIFDAKAARTQSRNYKKALEDCNAALLECSPPASTTLFRVLYTERGEAQFGLGNYEEALKDANNILDQSKEDYVSAWAIRIRCLRAQRNHQQICDDLEPIVRGWGSTIEFLKGSLREAKAAVNEELVSGDDGRINFYELLGVSRDATVTEIRKKYKKKAKSLHPDRFAGPQFTEEDRNQAEEDFKVLGEALELLCDSHCRTLYDAGHDLTSIRKEAGAAARRRAQEEAARSR